MFIDIISLFPEMFRAITNYGITGKAVKNKLLVIKHWNPRNFAKNKYKNVDARPYGGGPGMLMMGQPLKNAINSAKTNLGIKTKVVYLSPQGKKLNQNGVHELVKNKKIILVCGRYKGIDDRFIQTEIDEEWSIGDYILSGGELAAMVLIDAISRFIPGTLNHKHSAKKDSFSNGLLDCPHYTRPKILNGIAVPFVILSGNHLKINIWRMKQSLGRTWLKRPELLKKLCLTNNQKKLLSEFQQEYYEHQKK
ncbi:tRNA (guanine-N(1)-)-methyltransferase [Candidatus Providencia siddallii]|uniref:tRNA (guanine-N(1)-)-methyltransferase n=1 Tax=Candidatus Providencia siddallii TaxID=1715285 RepID=A0A0M6W9S6_9GAMM|nr:tRNA (guanine-N(1)-)-methyltransferase [Candidatus Providencia siddallii]